MIPGLRQLGQLLPPLPRQAQLRQVLQRKPLPSWQVRRWSSADSSRARSGPPPRGASGEKCLPRFWRFCPDSFSTRRACFRWPGTEGRTLFGPSRSSGSSDMEPTSLVNVLNTFSTICLSLLVGENEGTVRNYLEHNFFLFCLQIRFIDHRVLPI